MLSFIGFGSNGLADMEDSLFLGRDHCAATGKAGRGKQRPAKGHIIDYEGSNRQRKTKLESKFLRKYYQNLISGLDSYSAGQSNLYLGIRLVPENIASPAVLKNSHAE
jgi:hypothetical protein